MSGTAVAGPTCFKGLRKYSFSNFLSYAYEFLFIFLIYTINYLFSFRLRTSTGSLLEIVSASSSMCLAR